MSIYGPNYTTMQTSLTSTSQDLDMEQHKIINLDEPRQRHHAATAAFVLDLTSRLNTEKLSKAGDTMTGNLIMDYNAIKEVGNPVDETDAVNKQYVDRIEQHEHDTRPYVLSRYIVLPEDDSKVYFSVRARKNINLERGLLVEIKHDNAGSGETYINNRPQTITATYDIDLLPNPSKDLGIMQLNSKLHIECIPNLSTPWTLLFSARPGESPPVENNTSILTFNNPTTQSVKYLTMMWTAESFKYTITDNVLSDENAIIHIVDTTKLNHVTFQCVENKLNVWINGKQIRQHNLNFDSLHYIRMGMKELGIVSLYDRNLNKMEIVQHFVDHHVENFTDDEVLI